MMGNRGILHDDSRRIVRQWQVRRWITCALEFRGRRRKVMQPHRYTELFFLDEAASFSAGHRPCAECRRADYNRFVALWRAPNVILSGAEHGVRSVVEGPACPVILSGAEHGVRSGVEGRPSADSIDLQLHAERLDGKRKRTYLEDLKNLPDGTYIALDGKAWLVWDKDLFEWSDSGYKMRRPRTSLRDVEILTPRSLVKVFTAGYRPSCHSER